MRVEDLAAYELVEKKEIKDIDSTTYYLKHKKTGAKVALISNTDENKVFCIGFRTTPTDSTGVAHIIEHSVLCGSKDFPLKDPFVELVKGSLNTFLNAITYPDKTIYPIASCNPKDFQNLMNVYLNSVFYPNIYKNEAIFRQEGWHYELDDNDELTYNGVVYNEMKGALSTPDSILWREIPAALYPHNTYAVESGGDPADIPNLSYEQFLDFHRTYYHPSNSYIYLYGDMDMAEKLDFIDREYLSHFDTLEVHSEIPAEPAFTEPVRVVRDFPMSEGENVEDNTYLSVSYSVGDSLDAERAIALNVLDYVLCDAPGAPLKEALQKAEIGKDVFCSTDNSTKQPYFSFIVKGTDISKEESFKQITLKVLQDIVQNGFDKKSLLAALSRFEFKYREADFGSTPKGLMIGIRMFQSWLYDDNQPFLHIGLNQAFANLKEKVSTGYFENLVQEYILNNRHSATVIINPVEGLAARREEELKTKLAGIKKNMTAREIQEVRDMMDKLEAFRETPDDPKDLAKLPMLERQDLTREAAKLYNEVRTMAGHKLLFHNLFTNGIGYLRFIFELKNIPGEYYPYISMLRYCFNNVNTENYTYGELSKEMNLVSGDVYTVQNSYGNVDDFEKYMFTIETGTKALYSNLPKTLELMEEMIFASDFTDTRRLKEILAERNSQMRDYLAQSGHSVATGRALARCNKRDAQDEIMTGVDFYRTAQNWEQNFDQIKDDMVLKLQTVCKMIFRPENLLIDFTGEESALASLEPAVAHFVSRLYTCEVPTGEFIPELVTQTEAFTTSGQVDYVCMAGNYRRKGLPFTGALNVLRVMMGYEYLWINVRVKGGAYGCMCTFARDGASSFCSYRDPNLGVTVDVFKNAAEFIENYEADERTMTQYIIGTIGELDIPQTAVGKGRRSRDAYISGLTEDMMQTSRNQILDATPDDLRALGKYVRAFIDEDNLCVVGAEQLINKEKEKFDKIENLC